MSQHYNLADHGDLLEKGGAEFARNSFPHYERVWQIYIGNRGCATIAELPGYPSESKRVSFAEYSYSTFESCFMIHDILKSGIFTDEIVSFRKYVELNKMFITFFTYLGRIHDTAIKASNVLKYGNSNFLNSLKSHYAARNIVIHGKKIPFSIDGNDFIRMPKLQSGPTQVNAWDDSDNVWADFHKLPSGYISDDCQHYFDTLMVIINNEYAHFYDVIQAELKAIPTSLVFDRSCDDLVPTSGYIPAASGNTSTYPYGNGVDVYKINESLVNKKSKGFK